MTTAVHANLACGRRRATFCGTNVACTGMPPSGAGAGGGGSRTGCGLLDGRLRRYPILPIVHRADMVAQGSLPHSRHAVAGDSTVGGRASLRRSALGRLTSRRLAGNSMHGHRCESSGRLGDASVRRRSARRNARRHRRRPARRAARRIGPARRRAYLRFAAADERRRRTCGAGIPTRAARSAGGRAPRARGRRAGCRRSDAGRITGNEPPGAAGAAGEQPGSDRVAQVYLAEAKARIQAALGAEIGFAERLVWFWSNHFASPATRSACADLPAPMSARRSVPMCSADSRTCCSLSKATRRCCSISTTLSRPARIRSPASSEIRGLNENLAREIMELHTLGVRSGYTPGRRHAFRQGHQRLDDLARASDTERGGEFAFDDAHASAGRSDGIGKKYPDGGLAQGKAVLTDLARNPRPRPTCDQVCAALRRRRSAAGAGRQAGEEFHRDRRQPAASLPRRS